MLENLSPVTQPESGEHFPRDSRSKGRQAIPPLREQRKENKNLWRGRKEARRDRLLGGISAALPAVPLPYSLPVKGPVWSRREEAWKEACAKQEGLSFTMQGYELINLLLGNQKKPRGDNPPASFNSIIISVR